MVNIWYAAEAGDVGEVERLLGHATGLLNARDAYGETALMHASAEGHVEVARLLVVKGAALDKRDRRGRTALHLACRQGRAPVVRLLLESGALWVDFLNIRITAWPIRGRACAARPSQRQSDDQFP
jgi:ankyrin repeat protein